MIEGVSQNQEQPVSAWNAANALTMLRIALVPAFAIALFQDGGQDSAWRIWATVIFLTAAITDRFDGELARRRGLVTDFGKISDPIADKALIGTALIGLSIIGDLSWVITIVILVRELGITALRFAVIRYGVIPASRGGKLKTVLQVGAIGLYVLPLAAVSGALVVIAQVVMAAALVVTIITGIDYLYRARSLVRRTL